jgi:formylglycine-generating enzyme required for sulfatase activity
MNFQYLRHPITVLRFSLLAVLFFSQSAHAQIHVENSAKKPTALRLISPNGGEVFVSGSDTIIVWDGVPASQSVTVECSTDGGKSWLPVASAASGLRCAFPVPLTTIQRDSCLVRLITRKSTAVIDCMAPIPAGTFRMGDLTGRASDGWERPIHDVTITRPFLMCCTEVTQAQWHTVMGTYPSHWIGDNLPVEQVSWYDAVKFCNELSKIEGFDTCYNGSGATIICDFAKTGYRLPTEAEWEYACRGGTTTDFYTGNMTSPSGNDPALDSAGWYNGNSGNVTHEVGLKTKNAYGLYDMHGNVNEWCWDWFSNYPATPVIDPNGTTTTNSRVRRGGAYLYSPSECRSSKRQSIFPEYAFSDYGFRVVRNY